MILTCENCQARYLVAPHVLGEAGRRVRCTSCGHEWHQINEEPQDEDPVDFRSILDAVEPIPESVMPVQEEKPVLQPIPKKQRRPVSGRIKAYAAAAVIVLGIAGSLYPLKNEIVQIWPPAAGLYMAIGQDVPVKGEGLIFDQLTAEDVHAEGIIKIEGRIINLKSTPAVIPAIQATAVDDNNKPIARRIVDPGGEELKGQGETTFSVVYPDPPKNAKRITLRFVLGG